MSLKTVWTESEDALLRQHVEEKGPKQWGLIAAQIKTKSSKQCRRRWTNHLNLEPKTGGWTPEEDEILMEGHKVHGNKWTEIAKMVGGRTDNAVKNRYNAICKRTSAGGSGGRKRRRSDTTSSSDGQDTPTATRDDPEPGTSAGDNGTSRPTAGAPPTAGTPSAVGCAVPASAAATTNTNASFVRRTDCRPSAPTGPAYHPSHFPGPHQGFRGSCGGGGVVMGPLAHLSESRSPGGPRPQAQAQARAALQAQAEVQAQARAAAQLEAQAAAAAAAAFASAARPTDGPAPEPTIAGRQRSSPDSGPCHGSGTLWTPPVGLRALSQRSLLQRSVSFDFHSAAGEQSPPPPLKPPTLLQRSSPWQRPPSGQARWQQPPALPFRHSHPQLHPQPYPQPQPPPVNFPTSPTAQASAPVHTAPWLHMLPHPQPQSHQRTHPPRQPLQSQPQPPFRQPQPQPQAQPELEGAHWMAIPCLPQRRDAAARLSAGGSGMPVLLGDEGGDGGGGWAGGQSGSSGVVAGCGGWFAGEGAPEYGGSCDVGGGRGGGAGPPRQAWHCPGWHYRSPASSLTAHHGASGLKEQQPTRVEVLPPVYEAEEASAAAAAAPAAAPPDGGTADGFGSGLSGPSAPVGVVAVTSFALHALCEGVQQRQRQQEQQQLLLQLQVQQLQQRLQEYQEREQQQRQEQRQPVLQQQQQPLQPPSPPQQQQQQQQMHEGELWQQDYNTIEQLQMPQPPRPPQSQPPQELQQLHSLPQLHSYHQQQLPLPARPQPPQLHLQQQQEQPLPLPPSPQQLQQRPQQQLEQPPPQHPQQPQEPPPSPQHLQQPQQPPPPPSPPQQQPGSLAVDTANPADDLAAGTCLAPSAGGGDGGSGDGGGSNGPYWVRPKQLSLHVVIPQVTPDTELAEEPPPPPPPSPPSPPSQAPAAPLAAPSPFGGLASETSLSEPLDLQMASPRPEVGLLVDIVAVVAPVGPWALSPKPLAAAGAGASGGSPRRSWGPPKRLSLSIRIPDDPTTVDVADAQRPQSPAAAAAMPTAAAPSRRPAAAAAAAASPLGREARRRSPLGAATRQVGSPRARGAAATCGAGSRGASPGPDGVARVSAGGSGGARSTSCGSPTQGAWAPAKRLSVSVRIPNDPTTADEQPSPSPSPRGQAPLPFVPRRQLLVASPQGLDVHTFADVLTPCELAFARDLQDAPPPRQQPRRPPPPPWGGSNVKYGSRAGGGEYGGEHDGREAQKDEHGRTGTDDGINGCNGEEVGGPEEAEVFVGSCTGERPEMLSLSRLIVPDSRTAVVTSDADLRTPATVMGMALNSTTAAAAAVAASAARHRRRGSGMGAEGGDGSGSGSGSGGPRSLDTRDLLLGLNSPGSTPAEFTDVLHWFSYGGDDVDGLPTVRHSSVRGGTTPVRRGAATAGPAAAAAATTATAATASPTQPAAITGAGDSGSGSGGAFYCDAEANAPTPSNLPCMLATGLTPKGLTSSRPGRSPRPWEASCLGSVPGCSPR